MSIVLDDTVDHVYAWATVQVIAEDTRHHLLFCFHRREGDESRLYMQWRLRTDYDSGREPDKTFTENVREVSWEDDPFALLTAAVHGFAQATHVKAKGLHPPLVCFYEVDGDTEKALEAFKENIADDAKSVWLN